MRSIELFDAMYRVDCTRRYRNKQPCIDIYELDAGFPAGKLSVCIEGYRFLEGETAISCDVPQAHVIAELERAGIAKATNKIIRRGYGSYPIVTIL